ncbi:MAG TPA: exodeoxyribonuclease III [Steroidobacteraceae bacterium]|nr:exodeoxyribonuclease III [Steroidobacteraceae bacterium]
MAIYATWNVNSLRVRLPQLVQWLSANPVDVLAIQETKLKDAEFPRRELEALGFTVAFAGQKTYNGVATLARSAISDVITDLPNYPDPQRRLLAATVAGIRVINVYVPNGQTVDSEKYVYKLAWLEAFARFLELQLKSYPQALVLGDFNIAPEDRDVHDPKSWTGSVLVSEPERTALARLTSLGVSDLYRRFEQPEQSFSWWDYRQGAYRRNHGLRIDLILGTADMALRCSACRIDREPRAWERPSDHAPCTASFYI